MDTLYALVNLQYSDQSSFTSTLTSGSSFTPDTECFNLYMDDERASIQKPSFDSLASSPNWATEILVETGRAIATCDLSSAQQLMWMLNELATPYGDTNEKLAFYFLQSLFLRLTTGLRPPRPAPAASFNATRRLLLKFQEFSPWTTFGHVMCNGTILEAFEGETDLHIIDVSNTYCTQWPTLLEALATRSDVDTPNLRLTVAVPSTANKVMKEIASRMQKFARLMAVPFKFKVVYYAGDLSELNPANFDVKPGEALVVNCMNVLHSVTPAGNRRGIAIAFFRRLQPKLVTVVEEEAELDIGTEGFSFLKGFEECLRWFKLYFEALDESFPRVSNERVMLERAAGRELVDLLASPPCQSRERREKAACWEGRLRTARFEPVVVSEDVRDDVRALLRRHKEGWSMAEAAGSLFLLWAQQPVVWASAWRPH